MFLLMAAQIAVIFTLPVDFEKLAEQTIDNAWKRQLTENGSMAFYEEQVRL